MKIAQLMTGSNVDLENRKRAMQRREMGEAYKKTQQYQSAKNPLLEALENLLSGKTEKDLHVADRVNQELAPANDEVKSSIDKKEQDLKSPQVQAEVKNLQLTEKEVIAHEQAHKSVGRDLVGPASYTYTDSPDNRRYIDGGEVPINSKEGSTLEETLNILERVKVAALAPADPSPQDLRVATSATAQIQQKRGEITQERYEELTTDEQEEPFADVDLTVNVPERFLNNFESRDARQESLFGGDLEKLLYQRTFSKASLNYSSHTAMVKNGYRPFDEPRFSKTA